MSYQGSARKGKVLIQEDTIVLHVIVLGWLRLQRCSCLFLASWAMIANYSHDVFQSEQSINARNGLQKSSFKLLVGGCASHLDRMFNSHFGSSPRYLKHFETTDVTGLDLEIYCDAMTPKSIHARSRESPPACDIHMNLMLN